MQRIIVIGNGMVPYRVCAHLRSLDTTVDIIWMDFYSRDKYPWFAASRLLLFDVHPRDWSRQRAAFVVRFPKRAMHLGVQTDWAGRIRINAIDREFSVLTETGETTYEYDSLLLFPPLVPALSPGDRFSFPSSQCMHKLAEMPKNPESAVVLGDDPLLLQSCFRAAEELTWVRDTHPIWEPEIIFGLEQIARFKGVKIVAGQDADSCLSGGTNFSPETPVFFSSALTADQGWMEKTKPEDLCPQKEGIFLQIPEKGMRAGMYDPQLWVSAGCKLAEEALRREPGRICEVPCAPESGRVFGREIFRVGKTELESAPGGDFDLGVYSNCKETKDRQEYIVKMLAAKKTGRPVGFQALGDRACDWGNAFFPVLGRDNGVYDLLTTPLAWKDPGGHPLHEAASIIAAKQNSSAILNITPAELVASVREGAEFFLLDLREGSECREGMLQGAYNIPFTELKKRVNEIPRFTPLVLYSRSFGRAFEAAVFLRARGAKQLYVLDGGYELWPYEQFRRLEPEAQPVFPGGPSRGSCCR
ncbi:MAG: rhodanese-like domain-containing protein [Desulfonatronovibrionaceae bacterium]